VAANRTAVYIVDHDLKQIITQATAGYVADHDEITYDLLTAGISGLVFRSGQPVLSLSADDGIEPAETRERRIQNGTGALIVVPLVAQSQVIGTVTVSNLVGQRLFNQSDVDLLMTLTAQSVSVIEKLRLFKQAQRAFNDLDAINRRLTGEAWSDFTLRRADTGARWIGTTDRAQQAALPEVSEALAAGQIATRPQNGSGQLGIAVPIKVRGVSIGALRLVVLQTAWNDELRTTLDSIAGHVAQAAENARLIDQTQRAAQREKAIAGAADKIHRSTELEAVLSTAVNEINRITGLSGISVQLGFGQRAATAGHDHQPGKAGGK
jgi:GAF domain-containing protein